VGTGWRIEGEEGAVPWATAITWAAIGEGSARSGNLDRAAKAEQSLVALREATSKQNNVYWANQIEVQRREVSAWIAEKAGDKSDAVSKMRSAAELEESMDKHAVTPGPIAPARGNACGIAFAGEPPEGIAGGVRDRTKGSAQPIQRSLWSRSVSGGLGERSGRQAVHAEIDGNLAGR